MKTKKRIFLKKKDFFEKKDRSSAFKAAGGTRALFCFAENSMRNDRLKVIELARDRINYSTLSTKSDTLSVSSSINNKCIT